MNKFKSFTIVLGVFLLVSVTSCTKDNPKEEDKPVKKIQKVYVSDDYTYPVKELDQVWHWNGNKLESIDYYFDGTISWSEVFSYNENRVSRVEATGNSYFHSFYAIYEYEGNLIKTVNRCGSGNWGAFTDTYILSYQDGKLSKIDNTYIGPDKFMLSNKQVNPWGWIFSPNIVNCMDNITNQDVSRSGEIIIYQLTWTGNNLSRLTVNTNSRVDNYRFEYDTKKNPIYGHFGLGFLKEGGLLGFSENNVSKMVEERENDVYNYIYQYDDDGYPTMVTEYFENHAQTYYKFYEYE